MPATYVHHAFTNDVYKVLNKKTKDHLSEVVDYFNLFGKSFDILFFIKPKYGYYAHGNNSSLYFKNIIKYIIDNNLKDDMVLRAYLYGSICHYVLDSTIHPFVYYKSGQYKYNEETLKYRGMHSYVETMMDASLFLRYNNKPIYKANLGKILTPKVNFSENLLNSIDYAFINTYGIQDKVGKLFKKGYGVYRFAIRHVMTSRLGIKYRFYKFLDLFKILKKSPIVNYCYYVKKVDETVLNLEHNEWCYPVSKNMKYHYSFYDLYDIAIEKAREYINVLDNALDEDEAAVKKALIFIGNLSYYTGIDTDKNLKMKYFEF